MQDTILHLLQCLTLFLTPFYRVNICLLFVQFGALICEPHHRTNMPRNKIKQDFKFTTLKGFKIIKLTTCDRFYNNKKKLHLLRCLTLFLISFYRVNICLLWENIECSPLFVTNVNKKKLPPFDQCQITFLQVFIAVVVAYI